MGLWSYYFFAKLLLFFGGYIGFHFWANLGFALLLIVPLHQRWLRIVRQIAAWPAAIALLYFDSWLPPFWRALSQAGNLSQFRTSYLLELLGRFVDFRVVAVLLLLLAVHLLLARKLRMSSFALGAILVAGAIVGWQGLRPSGPLVAAAPTPAAEQAPAATADAPHALTAAELDARLNRFYQTEAARRVAFPRARASDTPFDIIVLHICSLAWDDLDYAGERSHPLMSGFDVTMTAFNSAASYSGPAAIRVLRGNCGQQKHADLYQPAPAGCSLFGELQQADFDAELLMNHDGHFGDFLKDVRDYGNLTVPLFDSRQAPVAMRAFDDSPVYDDGAVLTQWWKHRQNEAAPRVALYYNTMSLHDGNHVPGRKFGSARESFRVRVETLFAGFQRLFDEIKASGRKVVIVFVPEHGAALRGDRMQISGLREIPTPAITLVPVGIKLIGLSAAPQDAPQTADSPYSFVALSQLLAEFIKDDPFDHPQLMLGDYLRDLSPTPDFVSENEKTVILRDGARYMLRSPDGSWSEYPVATPDR